MGQVILFAEQAGIRSTRKRWRPDALHGFTIVELLAAIAIIGLLMALVLPAIQSARAASQKVSCKNRLKQIVLASHAYQEAHSALPVSEITCRQLLPFVGHSALYQQLVSDPHLQMDYGVTVFLCPSDPEAQAALGHMNYYVNQGSGDFQSGLIKTRFDGACPGPPLYYTNFQDFTDGTSSTALFAERKIIADPFSITSDDMARSDPNRYMWLLNRDFQLPSSTEFAAFRQECLTARATAVPQHNQPTNGQLMLDVGYNHALTPNRPGCHNNDKRGTRHLMAHESLVSSTSHHAGGVHVGFVDGHVQFIADSIDASIWTAISTRNGHETIGEF